MLTLAVVLAACQTSRTSPATSEALAQAIRQRVAAARKSDGLAMNDLSKTLEARERLGLWKHDLLADAARGLSLDRQIAAAFDAYWVELPRLQERMPTGPNITPAVIAQAKRNHAEAFRQQHDLLRKRIAAAPADTASRGLLATAVYVNLIAAQGAAMRYHRMSLLNDVMLGGKHDPGPAPGCPCPYYVDAACEESNVLACQGDHTIYGKTWDAAEEMATTWLLQIEAVNPESKWLQVAEHLDAMLSFDRLPTAVSASFQACDAIPEAAVWVTLSRTHILCDDFPVSRLEDGRLDPAETSNGGLFIEPLFQRLSEAMDERRRFGSDRDFLLWMPVKPEPETWLAVLYTAAQAGFEQAWIGGAHRRHSWSTPEACAIAYPCEDASERCRSLRPFLAGLPARPDPASRSPRHR